VLAGQGWRSYLRSRATPRSYEGMVKASASRLRVGACVMNLRGFLFFIVISLSNHAKLFKQ
ncbi:hypothetical protein, partial [Aeromonas hydrophila]|uniref:hypothetical protein n=1 Tax=Aeromonas hydrophila TaxID=644 RepID=UPI0039880630